MTRQTFFGIISRILQCNIFSPLLYLIFKQPSMICCKSKRFAIADDAICFSTDVETKVIQADLDSLFIWTRKINHLLIWTRIVHIAQDLARNCYALGKMVINQHQSNPILVSFFQVTSSGIFVTPLVLLGALKASYYIQFQSTSG